MDFEFQYRITYGSGQVIDRQNRLKIDISKEDYIKIVDAVLKGIPLKDIEGITEVTSKMTKYVEEIDGYYNMDGTLRRTALKKPRVITDLEFFFSESEYRRIKKMKDPLEVISRPKEQMTIHRNDGSYVNIVNENGFVKIFDSNVKNSHVIVEADHFISKII